jgi:tripartite-type tricarboxylate transporter receptor subunit TctC
MSFFYKHHKLAIDKPLNNNVTGDLVMKRILLVFFSLFISGICLAADEYPTRPITFILAVEPGSDGDVLARPLMQRVSKILGQPILILNKPGAGSVIGYKEIQSAKPDGYTLGWSSATIITNKLQGVSNLDYRDFTQLGAYATFFPILIASNTSAVKFTNMQEVVAYAKANPGKINLATAGIGQSWWVGAKTFLTGTNLEMAGIPVTGAGAAVATLVAGGHAELGVSGLASARPMLQGGQVRFIAPIAEGRASAPYDKFPTLRELGFNASWESTNAIIGPPNLPKDVTTTLVAAIEKAANDPEFIKFVNDRDARWEYLAPEKIIPSFDKRRTVVREIMQKAGLLKESP